MIDRIVPDGLDIHIVMGNYANHTTAAIKVWLARRPRWHVHFTLTPVKAPRRSRIFSRTTCSATASAGPANHQGWN